MSVWTTRSTSDKKEYIVIQHKLKNVDYCIQGIKFRGGYAVVEKDSKVYHMLKKIPLLKNAKEFPLIHLRSLPFITRTSDVKMIYGQEVYRYYLEALNPIVAEEIEVRHVEAEVAHVEEMHKCACKTKSGELCIHLAAEYSPSGYCHLHIFQDPRLSEFGITIPRLAMDEKAKFREKVIAILLKAKKEGKF